MQLLLAVAAAAVCAATPSSLLRVLVVALLQRQITRERLGQYPIRPRLLIPFVLRDSAIRVTPITTAKQMRQAVLLPLLQQWGIGLAITSSVLAAPFSSARLNVPPSKANVKALERSDDAEGRWVDLGEVLAVMIVARPPPPPPLRSLPQSHRNVGLGISNSTGIRRSSLRESWSEACCSQRPTFFVWERGQKGMNQRAIDWCSS